MSQFDLVFVLSALVYLVCYKYRPANDVLLLLATFSCLLHLSWETARWQMLPGYFCLLCAWLWRIHPGKAFSVAGRILASLLVSTTLLLSVLLPVLKLPDLSGPYRVGVIARDLVDINRGELFTPNPYDKRALGVKIWYPAQEEPTSIRSLFWSVDAERDSAMAAFLGLPEYLGFIFSHIARFETNSFSDATVAKGIFPILVFSHGRYVGTSEQNTVLMEHLASHGYIVASIDHPFWGLFYRYPDDGFARSDYIRKEFRRLFKEETTEELRQLQIHQAKTTDELSRLLIRASEIRKNSKLFTRFGLDILSADQSFVIDQLAVMNQYDKLLKGKMQLAQLGVFGMSDGGTTSLQTCSRDSRCKAVADIDGYVSVALDTPPMKVPMLLLGEAKYQYLNLMHSRAESTSFLVKVADTEHLNFSDFALLSPALSATPIVGEIDPLLGLEITNYYVKSFFDTALLGKSSRAMEAEKYTEVSLDIRNKKTSALDN